MSLLAALSLALTSFSFSAGSPASACEPQSEPVESSSFDSRTPDDELARLYRRCMGVAPSANRERAAEALLAEMGRRGGDRWVRFLRGEIARTEAWRDDQLGARGEGPSVALLWIALRRAERRPTPFRLDLGAPELVELPFPELPVFEATLSTDARDEVRAWIPVAEISTRWYPNGVRVETRDAGAVSLEPPSPMLRTGIWRVDKDSGPLDVPVPVELPRHVRFDTPDEHELLVSFHFGGLFDSPRGRSRPLSVPAPPLRVRWTPRAIPRADVEAVDVATLLADLDCDALPVLVSHPYRPGVRYERDEPAGEEDILAAGYAAVPGLIDLLIADLATCELTPRTRAWIFALLFDLTGVLDPRDTVGALGDYELALGFPRDRIERLLSFPSDGMNWGPAEPRPSAQRELAEAWARFAGYVYAE